MDFPDAIYRKLCSQATLHTKDGFFSELLKKLTEDVGLKWIDDVFAKQTLDKDKIRVCCSDPNVWKIINNVLINVQPLCRKKSAKAAMEARLEGDKAMKLANFQKATMFYSQSIIKSPAKGVESDVDDGLSLAKAYKARAQAHYLQKYFQAALTDLQLCLDEGYPEPLRYQVYKSIGDAYSDLSEEKRAKISYQLSLKLLEEQIHRLETTQVKGSKKTKSNDEKLKQTLQKEREDLAKLVKSKPRLIIKEKIETLPPQTYAPLPEISKNHHEKFPTASSQVAIRRTLEHGRFAVAAENIETGSTLVVEEAYASILTPNKFGSNCHHCYARLHSPVPCLHCAGIAFCSITCRSKAVYHYYECQFLGLFQGAGLSALAYLALRMLTQKGFTFFKNLQAKIENLKKGVDEKLSEEENQYVHVYNLTTHQNLRPNEDFFHRAVMSLFLVQCLKHSSFFPVNKKDATWTEDEIMSASLILHHLQVLQFNAHELYETHTTARGKTKGSKSVYVAVGIFPTVALFNHECAPAVTRYFHGKSIIIRTVRPLKKGDVVSENYGPIYTKRTFSERVRDLTSRYWFSCQCTACQEQWPTLEQLTDQPVRLKCPTPQCRSVFPAPDNPKARPTCSSCFNKVNLNEVSKQVSHYQLLFERAIKYLEDNQPEMAEPLLTAFLDTIYDISPPPSREIALAQEALRTCYAQTGNLMIIN